MKEMNAEKLLQKMGLSGKEAQVWLQSLKLGIQPASVIAKKLGLNRITTFVILNGLVEKGLAVKTPKGNTTWFQVLGAEALQEWLEREEKEMKTRLERQKKELKENLELLKKEEVKNVVTPKVKFFEGKKGMREAFLETLKLEKDDKVRGIGNFDEANKILEDVLPGFFEKKKRLGVKTAGISPATPLALKRAKNDKQEMRELKLVHDKKKQFEGHMEVWDDKALFLSYEDEMAILIENRQVTKLLKTMFDMLWGKMK